MSLAKRYRSPRLNPTQRKDYAAPSSSLKFEANCMKQTHTYEVMELICFMNTVLVNLLPIGPAEEE